MKFVTLIQIVIKKVLETFEVYLKMGIFLLELLCPPSKVNIWKLVHVLEDICSHFSFAAWTALNKTSLQ